MVENCYKVPKSQWKKWTPHAQRVFNELYSFSLSNQRLFLHPKAAEQSLKHWCTVSWNHAWTAADAVDNV